MIRAACKFSRSLLSITVLALGDVTKSVKTDKRTLFRYFSSSSSEKSRFHYSASTNLQILYFVTSSVSYFSSSSENMESGPKKDANGSSLTSTSFNANIHNNNGKKETSDQKRMPDSTSDDVEMKTTKEGPGVSTGNTTDQHKNSATTLGEFTEKVSENIPDSTNDVEGMSATAESYPENGGKSDERGWLGDMDMKEDDFHGSEEGDRSPEKEERTKKRVSSKENVEETKKLSDKDKVETAKSNDFTLSKLNELVGPLVLV